MSALHRMIWCTACFVDAIVVREGQNSRHDFHIFVLIFISMLHFSVDFASTSFFPSIFVFFVNFCIFFGFFLSFSNVLQWTIRTSYHKWAWSLKWKAKCTEYHVCAHTEFDRKWNTRRTDKTKTHYRCWCSVDYSASAMCIRHIWFGIFLCSLMRRFNFGIIKYASKSSCYLSLPLWFCIAQLGVWKRCKR